jgi:hypothetical protein
MINPNVYCIDGGHDVNGTIKLGLVPSDVSGWRKSYSIKA